MTPEFKAIIEDLISDGCVVDDPENPSYCFWCNAQFSYWPSPNPTTHDSGCAYIAACLAIGVEP